MANSQGRNASSRNLCSSSRLGEVFQHHNLYIAKHDAEQAGLDDQQPGQECKLQEPAQQQQIANAAGYVSVTTGSSSVGG
jgi:hypothetical protein